MKIDWQKLVGVEKPEESKGFMLWQTSQLWQREVNKILQPFELTMQQLLILAGIAWLTREDDLIATQVDIARFLEIDSMVVSQILKRLEKKNLVERDVHPHDTRAKIVRLTNAGTETFTEALPQVHLLEEAFFSNNDQLLTILQNIYGHYK